MIVQSDFPLQMQYQRKVVYPQKMTPTAPVRTQKPALEEHIHKEENPVPNIHP
jgi:hypothetical protein